jgi:hypothetical protein
MTQKWNLQDIRPSEPRRRKTITPPPALEIGSEAPRRQASPRPEPDLDLGTIAIKNGNEERRFNYLLFIGVTILIVGGLFGISLLVSKTTLTVYPEYEEPTVNAEFVAYPERRTGQLSYEIMTLTEEGERQVTANGQEEASEQATGFIEIIKSTPGAERLIKNTRFRSPDGLIFRIQESVVVPGAVNDGSGSLVPGTIRAEVFAESAGQEYNLAAGTRFDIPGFQENNLTELYNSIYAENREAFTGGFKGTRFIINDNELATEQQSLQMELRDRLLARIDAEKPADFVTFPGATAITYSSLPTIEYGENLVTIREQAVLQLPLFRTDEFASFIASETIPSYVDEPVRITNLHDLTFAYRDVSTNASVIANETALNFTILGKPQVVWEFDADQLKSDLAGKQLTAITTVLTGHTGIQEAKITGKPFWKRSFPENKDDITIIEVIGSEGGE